MNYKTRIAVTLLATQLTSFSGFSQHSEKKENLTPRDLIELNRVSAVGISDDGLNVIYNISKVDIKSNTRNSKLLIKPLAGGEAKEIQNYSDFIVSSPHTSPNGKYSLITEDVAIEKIRGTDLYPELTQSNMMVYNDLNYRHWDTWEDGKYSHVLIEEKETGARVDIMSEEPFDCPQKPFGGGEDYIWSADGESVLYVTKKQSGTAYATSTNTDIYQYSLADEKTINLTEEQQRLRHTARLL